MTVKKIGILLINVGTPEQLSLQSVKNYLSEFLEDPYIISIPTPIRKLLVHGLIVPFRSVKSFEKYKKIWTSEGSPLRVHLQNVVKLLQQELDSMKTKYKSHLQPILQNENENEKLVQSSLVEHVQYFVEGAMRYGEPSTELGLQRLLIHKVDEILVLPLYPQWSASTTESVIQNIFDLKMKMKMENKISFLNPFYNDSKFLEAHGELIKESIKKFDPDFILFSFHGLPDTPIAQRYYQECLETAKQLSLFCPSISWSVSFQSRLGPAKWLGPSTEHTIKKIANDKYKRLMVVSPSFVADGLETLEELQIEAAQQFINLTGGDFYLVPGLNSRSEWIQALKYWILNSRQYFCERALNSNPNFKTNTNNRTNTNSKSKSKSKSNSNSNSNSKFIEGSENA